VLFTANVVYNKLPQRDRYLTCPNREKLRKEILDVVKEKGMLPYYEKYLCPSPLGPADEALKAMLKAQNEEELQ
jgi:hypothetical protein